MATASRLINGFVSDPQLLSMAEKYLKVFGYITGKESAVELSAAIREAQQILGVKADSFIGDVTLKAMQSTPRCGCPDGQAMREMAKTVNRWGMKKITYTVVGYVHQIPEREQEEIFVAAWESWEKVCGIRLERVRNQNSANVIIDASASRREEFGTAGDVLAWAQIPRGSNYRSQLVMKFDLAEAWNTRIMLLNVAAHEFGHLLGITHTQIRGELMFPTYAVEVAKPQSKYDIPESVTRYGESSSPKPPTGTDPTRTKVEGAIRINGIPYELKRAA